MPAARTCSECGQALPEGTSEALCPVCALRSVAEGITEVEPEGLESVISDQSSVVSPRPFGGYELLEEIAHGGMGVVYKARQVSLGRIVAVKMILAGQFATPEFVQRFRIEAASAAVLHHPNIVAIHEVGVHAGQHYFSMDFVDGPSLAALVGHVPLPAKRAAQYVKTIAEAIHYAHQQGILHRDLKPSNVLIDANDQPCITDFGLAKRLEGGTSLMLSGQMVGSPNFMPPEQATAKHGKVGRYSDVYGLGGILYHLLTARPPFQADSLEVIVNQVLTADPVSPRILNPTVPRDLETICLKCLEKEPPRRYATAQALADELGRFLRREPILARPLGPIGKGWRWCRRSPVRAGLIAALLAVTLLGAAGVFWQWRQTAAALREAERAKRDAVEKLWGSYLAQARANRWSGRAGRRYDSLEVLRLAAAIRPDMELRNEAIACFTLPDAQAANQPWQTAPRSVVAFDPNCERFAYLNPPAGLAICRVADGAEVLRLPVGDGSLPVTRLDFSPNGELLAVAFNSPESLRLQVWQLRRRELRCGMEVVEGSRQPMVFSPDSRLMVVGDARGVLHVHDLMRSQKVKELQVMKLPAHLVFDPGGTRLAVCGVQNRDIQVVDFETGTILKTLTHPAPARKPSWHPDGVLLATPCEDFQLRLWDVPSGTVKAILVGHTGVPTSVRFNHAGDLLASSGWEGLTRFWDPVLGKELFSLPGGYVEQGSFNADDSKLPFGHHPQDIGVWQIATGRECRRLGVGGRTFGASFSADGRLLATAHPDGARLWDLQAGRQRAFLPARECRSALFHPDGQSLLLCGWMGLQQWPMQTMKNPDALTLRIGPPQTLLSNALEQARWAPDGQTLAVTSPQGIQMLELGPPLQVRHRSDHPNATFLALSGDGDWIATGNWKGQGVRVWNAYTGSLVTNLPLGMNVSVAFSPQSHWLVTGTPEEYRFWKVGSWELAHAVPRLHAGDMYGYMAFSPDGRTLALVRGRYGDLKLVEADTGREWASLDAGEPQCFSLRGNWLVTSEADGLLRLWDLRRIRQQLATLKLNWDAPMGDPEPPFASEKPLRIVVELEQPSGGK